MDETEKRDRWERTVQGIRDRDPRLIALLLIAMVNRHGSLVECEGGCGVFSTENITIEELSHVAAQYGINLNEAAYGILQINTISNERAHDGHNHKPKA